MASPEYEKLRAMLRPGLAVASDPPERVREKMHALHPTDVPEDVAVLRLELAGVPCAWVDTPEARGCDRSLFFVHGGAFVSTGIPHYAPYAARLSRMARARVLIFEYRLAPENRFPAALDDTLHVYRAARAGGMAPGRTAFLGDSCGGGIALSALCALRDAGEPLPAGYVGLTPWFDPEQEGESAREPRGVDPYVNRDWIRARFRDYAGPEADLSDPRLAPLRGRFSGLPPLYLGVGEIDTTRDDATRLAARAGRDGARVTLEIEPEMIHGFHGLCGAFPEATAAVERVGEFLRRCIP